IEIENGTGVAGYDSLAAERLNYAGYTTRIAAADRQDYGSTVLIDATNDQDAEARNAILNGLGLYSATVLAAPDPNAAVQYRLILGADYQACFQPQALAH